MLKYKYCKFNNKCTFAHKLSEQNIDGMRHKAYALIKNKTPLNSINLVTGNGKKLHEVIKGLTRVCKNCIKNICQGGFNCDNGAININYMVCQSDYMYGKCRKINCNAQHLTHRGLIPYDVQYKRLKYGYKRKYYRNHKHRNRTNCRSLKGVLLTAELLNNNFGFGTTQEEDTDSTDNEDRDAILKYLYGDSDSEDPCETSIFKE